MHWAHTVSTDLVHWEHLPIALYPDELGYIFSGSAVVDWNNTSGFGKDDKPPLIAIYSYHHAEKARAGDIDYPTQGIAYSNDRGRTWTKYQGNPVVKNPDVKDFRDPKVMWHEETAKWVMTVTAYDHLKFYGSEDLKNWNLLSEFGRDIGSHDGVWECPDLFVMKDENGQEKWVIIQNMNPGNPNGGSGTQYFIGQFDGERFSVDPAFEKALEAESVKSIWLDAGMDNYAGVTWSDIPAEDGRRIFLGWMSNWAYAQVVPTEKWRSAMTLPWELSLRHFGGTPRLSGYPVEEVNSLRVGNRSAINSDGTTALPESGLADIEIIASLALIESAGFRLSNDLGQSVSFYLDVGSHTLQLDRTKSGKDSFSEKFPGIHTANRHSSSDMLSIRAIIDASSIEIFVDEGSNIFTEIFFPDRNYSQVELIGNTEVLKNISGSMWEIQKIW